MNFSDLSLNNEGKDQLHNLHPFLSGDI